VNKLHIYYICVVRRRSSPCMLFETQWSKLTLLVFWWSSYPLQGPQSFLLFFHKSPQTSSSGCECLDISSSLKIPPIMLLFRVFCFAKIVRTRDLGACSETVSPINIRSFILKVSPTLRLRRNLNKNRTNRHSKLARQKPIWPQPYRQNYSDAEEF